MDIIIFEKQHIKAAMALALESYNEERKFVKDLPQACNLPDLNGFTENGLGVTAFENEKMVGFLCCYGPFDNAFGATDVRGVFSPMGANAAISGNRSKIYAAMYQAAGSKWVKSGAVSHSICLYAHDEALHRQFYHYGFGLRCIDAIRPMELIDCNPCTDYNFAELPNCECHLVYPLYMALNRHFLESPFFMNRRPQTQEAFIESSVHDGMRFFVAEKNGKLCAFLSVSAFGETCVAAGNTYRHISDAYCLPEHRGKGLYQNLLNYTMSTLKKDGYTKLGVDFESFNPTARGFWLKYFTAYTNGVVRRIDERILKQRC